MDHNILPADQLPLSKSSTPPVSRGYPIYKWGVVAMLWFICFFNYADRQTISSVLPLFEKEFGFNEEQLGLIGSAFMWVYALGAPFAGLVGDRTRRKDLILGGCVFWSIVTAMTGWCSRLWQFLTVRALEGFGETFYFPASMSLVSDYHSRRTRSRAMAIHQSSVYVGTIGGGWLGAWFAKQFGWRVGFYFFGLTGLFLALVLYGFLREPQRGEADVAAGEPEAGPPVPVAEVLPIILRSPVALLLLAAFLGANFVAAMFLVWTPKFLMAKFDYDLVTAGLYATLFIQSASVVSGPASGLVSDFLSPILRSARIIVQMVGLSVGAVFVFLIGSTSDTTVLLVVLTLFGFCKGIYDANIFASLYEVVEPRMRATAAGLMNMVGWAGGAFGPMWVGWMALHGSYKNKIENMSKAISLGGAVYIFSAILLFAAALLLTRQNAKPAAGRPGSDPLTKESRIGEEE